MIKEYTNTLHLFEMGLKSVDYQEFMSAEEKEWLRLEESERLTTSTAATSS